MTKSSYRLILGSTVAIFITLHLFCTDRDSLSSPNKTNASVVFMSSASKIYAGALADSVGKEIRIGTALYLPANFDSVVIQVLDNGSSVIDTVFRSFRSEYFKDTVWVTHTFLKPGVKNVTVTPFSTPMCPSVGATITIHGIEILPEDTTPPSLSFVSPADTNGTISTDTFTIDLLCSDPSGVASVSAAMGTKTFLSTLKNGHYIIPITGFTREEVNIVTVTATDSSVSGNAVTRKVYFNHQATTYSVKYQKGPDVSGELPVDSRMYEGGDQIIVFGNTGNLIRSGFTFSGWNTKEDGSGISYTGGSTFNIGNADVVLFAQWTTMPVYKVVYNGNGNTGGNVPLDSNNYIASTVVTVKENIGSLIKTGATFKGWNTAIDGSGTAYVGGVTFVMGNADVQLYAQWTTNTTFTVTYKGNGNSAGAPPVDANKYEQAAMVTVKGNTGSLVKPGATFTGWNTIADGSGTAYAGGVTFAMDSADVILYAQWTTNPTFTVTYNGNGNITGTVPVDANRYETAATVTARGNVGALVKTGATFKGWNTAPDGSGTAYSGGDTLAMGNADIVLYAQWTTNATFTVTYNGNGNTSGSVPVDANRYETAAVVTVKGNERLPAKTGATFIGWNTAADGSGTTYAAGVTFAMGTADVILYAQWTVNRYTVAFNSMEGSAVASQTVDHGGTVTEPAAPTRTGFTFGGWYTETAYTIQWNFTTGRVTANDTLFAKWTPNSYSVTFDGQSIIANSTKVVTFPKSTVETLPAPTAAGYQFGGWFTSINGGGTPFLATTAVTADITVYAKWTRVYKVKYNVNTGNGTPPVDTNTYSNGSTVSVLSGTGLSKTNYTFAGWNTQADTLGTSYTGGGTFTMGSADVVLYAKWRMNVPTISTLSNITCPVHDSVTFSVTATGAILSYEWQLNNAPISGATGSSYTTTKLTVADVSGPRTYKCVVTNPAGSVSSSATLAVSTVIDADGNIYHELKIGTQVWTMENLKTTKYNDGTPIPLVADNATWQTLSTPGYCWYANNETNSEMYGALYNWYTVNTNKVAPLGWRVPTDADWDNLSTYLGGKNVAGGKMKEIGTEHWSTPNGEATNESGFSALPCGYRNITGTYNGIGFYNYLWSATESSPEEASNRYLSYYNAPLTPYSDTKRYGFSVRCVRD